MGLAASQVRLLMLTARKSDLELQQQFVDQARMQIANMAGNLFNLASNLEPENPEAQLLQARTAAIQSMDKALELQTRRIDTQHQAVQTEIEAVQKVISKNIESTFKTFA